MIRSGLYHITLEMLDGIKGGNQGVMVVRDGSLRGGDSFFYAYGKQSIRFKSRLRLLVPD
jgi:hypothetical protein